MPPIAGVYILTDSQAGKAYIGSSIHLNRRISEHQQRLKANRHSNQHLQRAFNLGRTLTPVLIPLVESTVSARTPRWRELSGPITNSPIGIS